MRAHTLGLLLSSPIISAGIRVLLRGMSGVTVTEIPSTEAPGACASRISALNPSLMIVDPHTALCCPSEVPTALLSGTLLPESARTGHACLISIYESPESIKDKIKSLLEPTSTDTRGNDLSPREKEVILGVVKGLSNKEIAAEMNVSVNTIMTHRRNIASKLQVHSPAGLTIFAIATGMVKIDEVEI